MSAANRGRVLRAATRSFLRHGYRSSVDDIARRAGVAKQTVYHHFPSKDALFKEVATGLTARVLVELGGGAGELRASLVAFGLAYRRRVLGTEGVAMFRTLTAEVPRFPVLARALYAGGAGATVGRLAERLGAAMRAGRLRREEPRFAAELLLGMLAGQDRIKRLYGMDGGARGERRQVTRTVDCFLRAFAVNGGRP